MKRLFLTVLIALSSLIAFSQAQLQIERSIHGSFGDNPIHGGYWSTFLSYNFKCGIGVYNFSKSNDTNWYETLFGVNYIKDISKKATIEFGAAAGIERWCEKMRLGSYAHYYYNPNRSSKEIHQIRAFANYEYRIDDSWFRGYFSYNFAENFALGASYQSDAALGPRFDAMFWFTNVWVVPGYFQDGKSLGVQAGLSFNF